MKDFFSALSVAFSMYSRIPMPQAEWNKKTMRFALLFFPLVGAVVAAVLYGVFLLFRQFSLSPVFFASAGVFIPVMITGGIHLDGYCDTCDALAAHGDRADRLRIMKDPHVGAFGVIYTVAVLLIQFGAWHQLYIKPKYLIAAFACFVLSRVLAALAIVNFTKAKESGLAATFSGYSSKTALTVSLIILAAVATLVSALCGLPGLLVPATSLLVFTLLYRMAKRQFGGITGDLAGFYITVCETLALCVSAVLGAIV